MLKGIWNDPVWSKVIAAGILAMIAFVGTYFLNWWPIIWAKMLSIMNAIWKLVVYSVNIPAGVIVGLVLIVIWLYYRKKSASSNIATEATPLSAPILHPAANSPTASEPIKPHFSSNEESVIKILAAADGQWMKISEIATSLKLSRLVTEQAVERLFHLDFLIDSLNISTGRSFRLSSKGRDYAIEHNYVT